jgi:hypothetical protein
LLKKFNIYNLIVEVPGMQLPLERGIGGFLSAMQQRNSGRSVLLSAAADRLPSFAALRALFFFLLAKTQRRKEFVVRSVRLPEAFASLRALLFFSCKAYLSASED